MSMKSFDKFCEAMINPDKDKYQEIFDERQKQMQLHIVIEALVIFVLIMFAHCVISDCLIRWSESNTLPMLLYAMICVLYYIIKAGVKGCFIGVNGAVARYVPAGMCILLGFMNGFRTVIELSDDGWAVIKDNMVTDSFIGLLTYALMMLTGVFTIIFIKKSEKEEQKSS